MSLPLPGERQLPFAEALVGLAVMIVLCSLGGCAHPVWTRTMHATMKPVRLEPRATRAVAWARAARDRDAAMDAITLLEGALGAAGLRVGTDGRVETLWMYLRSRHETVDVRGAHPGDVVLFDTRAGERRRCADHAGIIEAVEPDGRIRFIDARGGHVRSGVLHPLYARARRDGAGEVMNSFLRPRRIDDPPRTPYLAGDMLCAVVRLGVPRD